MVRIARGGLPPRHLVVTRLDPAPFGQRHERALHGALVNAQNPRQRCDAHWLVGGDRLEHDQHARSSGTALDGHPQPPLMLDSDSLYQILI